MGSRTHSLDVLADGSIRPSLSVPAPQLYRVKRDQYTTFQLDAGTCNVYGVRRIAPNPAVFRTGEFADHRNFRRAVFGSGWQLMTADLLAMRKYGQLFTQLTGDPRRDIIRAFNSLTAHDTAFTNVKGTDNCNNYVEGIMRGEDPKFDPLICADDIVEVLDVGTNDSGIRMAKLRTFTQPVPVTMELLRDPRVLRATIISETGSIREFDQLKDGKWVPYPYIAVQDCWYPLADLERV